MPRAARCAVAEAASKQERMDAGGKLIAQALVFYRVFGRTLLAVGESSASQQTVRAREMAAVVRDFTEAAERFQVGMMADPEVGQQAKDAFGRIASLDTRDILCPLCGHPPQDSRGDS